MKLELLTRKKDKIVPPLITMPLDTYLKLKTYIKAKTIEITLLGTVDCVDNKYIITDFLIPPQTENSSVYTTTDDDRYPKWITDVPREIRQKLRCHLHTHPNMGTSPSGTDISTINAKIEEIDNFYIRIIANRKMEFHIDFYDIKNRIAYLETELIVNITDDVRMTLSKTGTNLQWRNLPNAKELEDALDAQIKVKKVAPYTGSYYGGSYNYYEAKKEAKKEEKKEAKTPETKTIPTTAPTNNNINNIIYFIKPTNLIAILPDLNVMATMSEKENDKPVIGSQKVIAAKTLQYCDDTVLFTILSDYVTNLIARKDPICTNILNTSISQLYPTVFRSIFNYDRFTIDILEIAEALLFTNGIREDLTLYELFNILSISEEDIPKNYKKQKKSKSRKR